MTKKSSKIIHAELKEHLSKRFNIIKSALGIQNDAEVVRFLIQNYFNQNLKEREVIASQNLEEDRKIIKQFMDKYGEEWRKLGEE
jgi:CHAD domain-containing protein